MEKLLAILALALVFFGPSALGQEVVTNENGQKIVVHPDGTWQYFDMDSAAASGTASAYVPPKSLTEEQATTLSALNDKAEALSLALIRARLELVEHSGNPDPVQVERYGNARQAIGNLEAELANIRLRQDFITKNAGLPPAVYHRRLKRFEEEHPIREANPETVKNHAFARIDANAIADGILLLPPTRDCSEGTMNTAQGSKRRLWETAATTFFSHTDKALEQQFPKADLLSCTGYLSAVEGGLRLLNLEFAVTTANAPQIYGAMPQHEFLELTLLDGQVVRLFNQLPNNGGWVAKRGAYVAHGRYALGGREEKLLRSKEVDHVLLRWQKVEERLPIYEVDFLMRQFQCLDALMEERKR